MSEEVPPTDLLPLLFTTALVAYVLAMGSADLARSIIRTVALACAAACLAFWAVAAMSYDTWGLPVISEFYATALLADRLGTTGAAWLLILLAVVGMVLAMREAWRLHVRGRSEHVG